MTKSLEYPYWYLAIAFGSLLNLAAFMLLPTLGYNKPVMDIPTVVVDFMEWREPVAKPAVESMPVKSMKQEKPKPKPRPVIKPPTPLTQPITEEAKLTPDVTSQQSISEAPTAEEIPKPEPLVEPLVDTEKQETEEKLPTPVPIFKLTSMPRFIHRAQVYPPVMQSLGKEAIVKLEALIDKQGTVRQVRVTESAGEDFDQAAIESLKASTFVPGNVDGKPVAVLMRIPVVFQLR